MNISEDKIDDFVNGRLTKEEMNKISEMAKSDPDLTTAIEDAKISLAVSNHLLSDDIRTMTNQWRDNKNSNSKKQQLKTKLANKKSVLLLVLAFLLFITLAIVIFNYSNHESIQKNDKIIIEPQHSDSLPDQLNETRQNISPSNSKEESTEKSSNSNEADKNIHHDTQKKLIASRLMPILQKETILRSSSNIETQLSTTKILDLFNQKDLKGLESVLTKQKQNSALQIFTKELIARTLFEKGAYQKAIIIFEELAGYDMPNREDYEFMLLLSYYTIQPLESNKFNDLKNKIAKDKDHTYHYKINQLI